MKNIALRNAIFVSDFTQGELAAKVGINPAQMSQAVNHGLRFSEDVEKKIAKILDVRREVLFNNGGAVNENQD